MSISPERLRERRERNKLSKRKAAKLIGVSQPAYLRYESGERTPSVQVTKEIAKVFHTSVNYLSGESNNPSPDILEVSKYKNEDTFNLIEKCNSMSESQLKRVLAYAERICEE